MIYALATTSLFLIQMLYHGGYLCNTSLGCTEEEQLRHVDGTGVLWIVLPQDVFDGAQDPPDVFSRCLSGEISYFNKFLFCVRA